MQADFARLRILIVGLGTLGLDIATRLAASGVESLSLMDFDTVKNVNLDRLIGATPLDAILARAKLEVAEKFVRNNATASNFQLQLFEGSIVEPDQFSRLLDHDLVFCCVDDHAWPRSVINTAAYTDLIPVVDGGIHIDAFPDGSGMRNAIWRSHVLRPGRPCMACNGQIQLGQIQLDKEGLLRQTSYIDGLPDEPLPNGQNVSLLAAGASAALLAQFVSFMMAPGGMGDPGPLRFIHSTHWLEHLDIEARQHCPIECQLLSGDCRQVLLDEDTRANQEIKDRKLKQASWLLRIGRFVDNSFKQMNNLLTAVIARRSGDAESA